MSVPLRRNRDFVALWAGQAVSNLGIGISSFAYPLVVLAATGSPVRAGAVGAVLAGTAFVLRLPAGVLVDRWDRRRIMLWCDAGRVANSAALAVALATGHFWFPHVLAVAFVEAALGVLFGPAESAAVRRVVGPEQARDAVATNAARALLPGVLGPPLGGTLLAAGRSLPFVADAVSYAASLVCVLSVRTDLRVERARAPRRPLAEMLDGLRWIRGQRFLRALLLLFAVFGLPMGGLGLLVLVLAREHGAGSGEVGAMFAITALGGAVGALLTPRLVRSAKPFRLIAAAVWVDAVATLSLAVVHAPLLLGAVGAVVFFFLGPLNAVAYGTVAADAPDELQGRVTSASIQVATLTAPLAPLLAGVLVSALGARTVAVVYGCACAAFALGATLTPSLRLSRAPAGSPRESPPPAPSAGGRA
jgi:MFS family permease